MTTKEEGIRLARRRVLEADVVLRDPEGRGSVSVRCRDLSLTGLFVYTPAFVPEGSEFVCEISVDGTDVAARGRVARVHHGVDRVGMGIQFVALPASAQRQLVELTAA